MSYSTEKEKELKFKTLRIASFTPTQAAAIFNLIESIASELESEIENLQKEIDDQEGKISALETRLDNV